jgi:multidrug efflux pump subunit AcrB
MSNYTVPPQQQYTGPVIVQQTSTMAIISLISGILGWTLVPTLGAIVAIITGHIAHNEIRASHNALSGDGLATAGLILGWVNLAFSLIGVCLAGLAVAGLIATPVCLLPFSNSFH